MPRPEPIPLRWTEEAEARRISENAMLLRHHSEQIPQILPFAPEAPAPSARTLLAAFFTWFFAEFPERPAEQGRKWHDGMM